MKKDKHFSKMASMPEKSTETFRPSIVSEARPIEVSRETQDEIAEATPNFNGEMSIRIPKSLYRQLNKAAEEEGVSLKEYILYKLAGVQ